MTLQPMLLNLSSTQDIPGDPATESDSEGPGALRVCMSNKLPGDGDAVFLDHTWSSTLELWFSFLPSH